MLPSLPRCRCRRLCALALPLLLGSCMTMGLWGYEWQERWNPQTHEDDGGYELRRGAQWEWWRVLLRVVATPVTLAGDLAVGMVEEVVLFGWLRDDDRCDAHPLASPNTPRPPEPSTPASGFPNSGTRLLNGVRR